MRRTWAGEAMLPRRITSPAMLDPCIYRTGLVVVALAVIVVAFSLGDQQGAIGSTLAPAAFNGQNAYATMTRLAARYPDRRPGSAGDRALAADMTSQLRADGFSVSARSYSGWTAERTRQLQSVTATLAGPSSGSVVVVAHRDALRGPSAAGLSGTAVLLELARDLSGETQTRTIVLASISGSLGGVGATELAHTLPGPVDAVIVLGDLAGSDVRQPVVVPWSNTSLVAPPMLRNTVAAALGSQANLSPGSTSLGAQFLHLALPTATTDQSEFNAEGDPSVLLSLSGDHSPSVDEPTTANQISALGHAVLQTVGALSAGAPVAPSSTYLWYGGKLVPAWAVRLLVLALIVPVLGATIDGVARARRRGYSIGRWLVWVLSAAAPFALAVLGALALHVLGYIDSVPPGPTTGGVVPMHGSSIAVMAFLVGVIAAGFAVVRPLVISIVDEDGALADLTGPGAAAALLVVLCAATIAIWLRNPFTAVLILPALHLWMWAVGPGVKPRRTVMFGLLAGGLLLPALAIAYYAHALGLTAADTVWSAILQLAGGRVGPILALEGCALLGCLASLVLITLRSLRERPRDELPIAVRGPIGYAGPGSLGGTSSALRR